MPFQKPFPYLRTFLVDLSFVLFSFFFFFYLSREINNSFLRLAEKSCTISYSRTRSETIVNSFFCSSAYLHTIWREAISSRRKKLRRVCARKSPCVVVPFEGVNAYGGGFLGLSFSVSSFASFVCTGPSPSLPASSILPALFFVLLARALVCFGSPSVECVERASCVC